MKHIKEFEDFDIKSLIHDLSKVGQTPMTKYTITFPVVEPTSDPETPGYWGMPRLALHTLVIRSSDKDIEHESVLEKLREGDFSVDSEEIEISGDELTKVFNPEFVKGLAKDSADLEEFMDEYRNKIKDASEAYYRKNFTDPEYVVQGMELENGLNMLAFEELYADEDYGGPNIETEEVQG